MGGCVSHSIPLSFVCCPCLIIPYPPRVCKGQSENDPLSAPPSSKAVGKEDISSLSGRAKNNQIICTKGCVFDAQFGLFAPISSSLLKASPQPIPAGRAPYALLKEGETVGYYSTAEASYGLQAGAQTFGYAVFFMTDDALQYLEKSAGFEFGVGPTIVVVDEGLSKSLTTTTLKDDVYAFFFGQKGLMGGLGLKGSKITKITPSEE